jgi:putative Mg2+ transporter-C (MgtC) family protein
VTEVVQRLVDVLRLDLMLQLALATVLGGAIGLERELAGKPAGLRTNILICMGSVIFTQLSLSLGGPTADPTRVAAQIVTGVGFIGAGTILHARGAVVGLTSAATIWVVAAIGVALGAGRHLEAVGATVFVVAVLKGLVWLERLVERQATTTRLSIHARPDPGVVEEIEAVVRRAGLDVARQQQRRENADLVLEYELRGPKRLHAQALIALLHQPGVRTVSTGE